MRLALALRDPRLFRAVAVLFPPAVGWGVAHLYLDGAWDLWEHLAAIRALASSWTPGHPFLAVDAPSHLYTPYHAAWAFAMRATGADVLAVAVAAAVVNTALFVGAVAVLDRLLGGDGRDRLLLLMVLLLAWLLPWRHSGVYGLGLYPMSAVFASACAQPVAVFVVALARWTPRERPGALVASALRAAGVASGGAFVFLSHPPTGLFLLLALGLLGVRWLGQRDRRAAELTAGAAGAAALCLGWPLYSVAEAVGRAPQYEALGFAGEAGLWQQGLWFRLVPTVLGVAYVASRLRARSVDGVAALALASAAVFVASTLAGGATTPGRFVLLFVFACHLGTVLWLRGRPARTLALAGAALAVLAVPEAASAARRLGPVADVRAGAPLGTHTHAARRDGLRRLLPGLHPGDVVLAPVDVSWWLPALTGARVVAAAHSDPFVADHRARRDAVGRFFDAGVADTAGRRALIRRHRADYVLVPEAAWRAVAPALPAARLVAAGAVVRGGPRYLSVRPAAGATP